MKKWIIVAVAMVLSIVGCTNLSEVESRLNDLEGRVASLEQQVENVNDQLSTIQGLLSGKLFIQSADALADGSGYKLTLVDAQGIIVEKTVLNGQDGQTPVVGVKKDTDGQYYWTVNGEWLLDNGKKVRASAIDGKSVEVKVDGGKWYYRLGTGDWVYAGEAVTVAEGPIKSVDTTTKPGYVIFTLSDNNTLELPLGSVATKIQLVLEENAFADLVAGGSSSAQYEVIVPQGITYTLDSYEPESWQVNISEPKDNKGTVTITLPENAGNGKIMLVVTGSDGSQFVKVVAITVGEIVDVTNENVDSSAGTLALPAGATDAQCTASWISIQGSTIKLDENTDYDSRTATVTYKDAEGKIHVIVITQAQKDAIVLTASTLSANADGESLTFVLKANVTVSAKADAGWLSVSPATKSLEDKSFTIVASANETGAARQGTVSFTSGELKQVVTVKQAAKTSVNPPVGGDGEYVLVTDASELAAGDQLLIVNQEGTYVMAGQIGSSSRPYRDRTAVTATNGVISDVPASAAIVTLEGEDGAWNLAVEGGYLAALSSGNYLKTATQTDDYATWSISVASDGKATVLAKRGSSNMICYNNAASRFSCYGSTTTSLPVVSLYRLPATPAEPVTQYSDMGLYLGSKVRTYVPGTDQYLRSYEGNSLSFVLLEPEAKEQLVISGIDASAQEGAALTLAVKWKKGTKILVDQKFSMNLLKNEGGMLWIGDNKGRGFIIKK